MKEYSGHKYSLSLWRKRIHRATVRLSAPRIACPPSVRIRIECPRQLLHGNGPAIPPIDVDGVELIAENALRDIPAKRQRQSVSRRTINHGVNPRKACDARKGSSHVTADIRQE